MDKKAIALGFFDGVHIGHQAILRKAAQVARQKDVTSAALTFKTHPRSFVRGISPQTITGFEERCRLIQAQGIDRVLALDFDSKIADTEPRDFVKILTEEYGACAVICGESFRFGRDAAGTPELFEQLGIEVYVCPKVQTEGGNIISSTAVRRFVRMGEMDAAREYLGRPFSICGEVVNGNKIGRRLGFPTLNMHPQADMVLPRRGVYAGVTSTPLGDYPSLVNVGSRPTFSNADIVSIESHLLGFSGDLYGKIVRVEFNSFLRGEMIFASAEELREQIATDLAQIERHRG